jgi:hypothetical protein
MTLPLPPICRRPTDSKTIIFPRDAAADLTIGALSVTALVIASSMVGLAASARSAFSAVACDNYEDVLDMPASSIASISAGFAALLLHGSYQFGILIAIAS